MNDYDTRGQDDINGLLDDIREDESPNVLTWLANTQWVGSDSDVYESIRYLVKILNVRADRKDRA